MHIVREAVPDTFEEVVYLPSIVAPDGTQYPWQIVDLWSDAELETLGIYRVEPVETPEGKLLVGYEFGRDGSGKVSYIPTFEDIPVPGPPSVQELAAYAAEARYRKEIAGVAWGDYIIQTDRESQSKMLAEFVAMGAGLRADPSPWKFADNKFAVLSNADMAAVCLAGRAHVAAAFAAEQTVQDAITAGTITTFAEIDSAFA
jgi:hypothetical protein